MSEQWTKLSSLRNLNWKKLETEKVKKKILQHIPMDNITELNELIYAGWNRYTPKEAERKYKTWMKNDVKRTNKKTANCIRGNISTDKKQQKTRKQKLEEKQLHGYFKRQSDEIAQQKTCIWPIILKAKIDNSQ